jgi:hypothetical protein
MLHLEGRQLNATTQYLGHLHSYLTARPDRKVLFMQVNNEADEHDILNCISMEQSSSLLKSTTLASLFSSKTSQSLALKPRQHDR